MNKQFVKFLMPKFEEVIFELFIDHEDISIRGNAINSGNPEFDRQVENELIERVSNGDLWAWCVVNLKATYKGISGTPEYLGACSYKDEKDFMNGGYYSDMKKQAFSNLMDRLRSLNN